MHAALKMLIEFSTRKMNFQSRRREKQKIEFFRENTLETIKENSSECRSEIEFSFMEIRVH